MKKILDIVLIFMISLLIFSFFFNPKKDKALENVLEINLEEEKYTIPASVKVQVVNSTSSGVTINTCRDVSFFHNGERIEFAEEICKDIEAGTGSTSIIDYSTEYEKFNTTGEYTMEIQIDDKKYIDQFELKNKGIISKTFIGIIYRPIYNLLSWIIMQSNGSLGWGIIGITIILKIVLLYPQQKMMVSQRKLQTIQPKIKQIQEQYKGDQAQMGQKLMELYSKEKINPFGSCGFLLIQMPILLVVYNIIRGIQSPTNEYYLYSFLSDFSLGSINYDFFGLDLLGEKGIQGILLALVVALIQFIQIKVSLVKKEDNKEIVLEKKKDEKDYSQIMPDADMMNKFMLYGMPIMIGVITYSWFAAIGLYWGMSTFFTLIQNLVVNKIIKK